MTNPARQAAETITRMAFYPESDPEGEVESIIQAAIDAEAAESCQLISDLLRERIELEREIDDFACELRDTAKSGLRLAKQLTRERDEAREAAQCLWREYIRRGPESSNFSQRFPWLKESP